MNQEQGVIESEQGVLASEQGVPESEQGVLELEQGVLESQAQLDALQALLRIPQSRDISSFKIKTLRLFKLGRPQPNFMWHAKCLKLGRL